MAGGIDDHRHFGFGEKLGHEDEGPVDQFSLLRLVRRLRRQDLPESVHLQELHPDAT